MVLSTIKAQPISIDYPKRILDLEEPERYFSISGFNASTFSMLKSSYNAASVIVFKSPVKHVAFFCRMEDATVKKFGVMIQVHAGDYASWMDRKVR